jgi:hypothetical protein
MQAATPKDGQVPTATPPLSILDLLVGVGTIALGLTFYNLLRAVQPALAVNQALGPIYACLGGASVASLPRFLARWRRRECPLLSQPGHWLLAVTAVVTLLNWGMYYGMFWKLRGEESIDGRSLSIAISFLGFYAVTLMVAALLFGLAAWRLPSDACAGAWRLYFSAQVLLCLTQLLMVFIFMLGYFEMMQLAWGGTFSALLPAVAIAWRVIQPVDFSLLCLIGVWDWRSRVTRDWLHRAGILLLLAMGIFTTLQSLF